MAKSRVTFNVRERAARELDAYSKLVNDCIFAKVLNLQTLHEQLQRELLEWNKDIYAGDFSDETR